MNLSNKCYPLFMIMILVTFSQIASAKPLTQVTFTCVRSFERYAYGLPGYEINDEDDLGLQWQSRFEVPQISIQGRAILYNNSEVRFSRIINSQKEIWLTLDTRGQGGALEYGIYNTSTEGFRRISAEIDNLNLVANQLFLDFDGTVWGIVERSADENDGYLEETEYYPNVSDFFPLAYFDEVEQQFKLATGEPRIVIREDEFSFVPEFQVLVDDSLRVFWLFDDTAVHRYDPQTQSSTLVYSFIDDGLVSSSGLNSNGEIYFLRSTLSGLTGDPWLHQPNTLFVLIPETNSVQIVNDPPLTLPEERRLFVDNQDNLWLGAIAYRDRGTGSWEIVHPDPEFGIEKENFIMFWGCEYPEIVLADTRGHLWFSGRSEPLFGATGLAWYDPATGNGCNNIPNSTNIIEDTDGNLWFFTSDGKLYQSVDSVTSFNVSLTLARVEEDTHEPQ